MVLGVPLIDGGTVRLPQLIGFSRAMDMILTGREVDAKTAFDWGLVNRLTPHGTCAFFFPPLFFLSLIYYPSLFFSAQRRHRIGEYSDRLSPGVHER